MAGKVKGITVEIGGDTNGLTKALSKVKKEINSTQNELKAVDRLLKLDPKNTELLAQKQQLLAKQTDTVKDKLDGLKKAKKQCDDDMKNGTEINQRQYRELQREIADTEQKLKSLARQASQSGIDKVTNGAKNLAKGAAITATAVIGIGTAAYATANKIADAGDEIDKNSQKVGLSIEAYQKWDHVMQISGTSMQDCTVGMKTLTNQIDNANNGNKGAIANFEKLGVSLIDLKTLSREDLFAKVVTGLQGMKDSTERAAIANDLFGKSGQNLTPLFNTTAEETKRLMDECNVLTDSTVKNSAAFKDAQTQLNNALSTLGSEILANLMPLITSLMDKLKEFISSHKEQIQGFCDRIKEFGKWCIDNMGLIEGLITAIGTAFIAWNVVSMIQGLVSAIKAFKLANEGATVAQAALNLVMSANPIGIVITVIVALVAAFVVLWKKCDGFRNFWINLWDKIKNAAMTAINFVIENWKEIGLFIVNPIAGAIALLYKLNPKFKAWVDKIILFFKELPKNLLQIGKDLVKGLWNGINDKVEWLKGKVKGVVDKIKSWFTNKDGFDEHSPSKWAKQVGEFLMEGLANGITEDMSAEDALKKKLDNIKNFIDENISSIRNDISQKRSSFADTLNNGSLYDTTTFTLGDNSVKKISFHDFTKDTQANLEWASLLTEFENRLNTVSNDNDLNYTLMQMIRDMGMTDGTQFINMAMQSNDSKFRDFVEGWQTYRKSAEIAAAQTYSRESEQLQTGFLSEVENGLTSIIDSFKSSGENSAEAFKAGFMDKIKSVMTQIQSIMQNYYTSFNLSGIVPDGAGNSSTVTNNSTKNFSVNITNGSNVSPFEQRQQINRLFDKMQLQEEL